MKLLIALVLCVALVGCSSDSATGPPPEDEPGEFVSYEAIAGTWSGWDYTADFALRAEISEEARVDRTVGDVNVFRATEHGLAAYCGIIMKAESADPPVYVFDGSSGSCTPTTLTLHQDVDNKRIELHNSNGESGYLISGSDPGPPPE